jgi:FkbM family methyltransferase
MLFRLRRLIASLFMERSAFHGDQLCWTNPHAVASYAQFGEDILLKNLFEAIGVSLGRYVDVGANEPVHFSNTYMLYRSGWRGICVEPQQPLADQIRLFRPHDQVVNAGLGVNAGALTFYEIHPHTLSTFDPAVAQRYVQFGHPVVSERPIPVLSVREFIDSHQISADLDLLSIDIEGDEHTIVAEFINQGVRPKVIVCETREYSRTLGGARESEKIRLLTELGYTIFADTYVNSIFLDQRYAEGPVK